MPSILMIISSWYTLVLVKRRLFILTCWDIHLLTVHRSNAIQQLFSRIRWNGYKSRHLLGASGSWRMMNRVMAPRALFRTALILRMTRIAPKCCGGSKFGLFLIWQNLIPWFNSFFVSFCLVVSWREGVGWNIISVIALQTMI